MKLYFDIGNTNIKINYTIGNTEEYFFLPTSLEYTPDSLYKNLPIAIQQAKVQKTFISSVVPSKTYIIEEMIQKHFKIEPTQIAFPIKTGIKLGVDEPKTIGSDLVCLAAYVAEHSTNGIIVNLGTATTIVHIKNKEIQGIVIMPGLMISFDSLIQKAAFLSQITLNKTINKNIGKNTADSISIGLLKGHAASIKTLVHDIDSNATKFISGGCANNLSHFLQEFKYVKEATIEGMKVIEARNEN